MNAIEQLDRQIDRLETKLEALREARQIVLASALPAEPSPVVPVEIQQPTAKPVAQPAPKKLQAQPGVNTNVGWAPKIVAVLQKRGPMPLAEIAKAVGCDRSGNIWNRLNNSPHLFRRCAHDSQLWELCPAATTTEPHEMRSMPTSSTPSGSV